MTRTETLWAIPFTVLGIWLAWEYLAAIQRTAGEEVWTPLQAILGGR